MKNHLITLIEEKRTDLTTILIERDVTDEKNIYLYIYIINSFSGLKFKINVC